LDSADTSSEPSGLGGDVDISSISPSWSPGVSDDVVLLSIFDTISDSGNGVIEGGSASAGVHDTTGVTLEGLGVSFNGNGNWSLSNSSNETFSRPFLDVVDLRDESDWGSLLCA